MRKSNLLGALVSRTKQQILAATLMQPEREWYLLELARHLGVRPSSLQRDLKVLTEAGILKSRKSGNRAYFQADTNCPIHGELAQVLLKTVGLVDVLREALRSLANRINFALVYGSIATASERSHSDIDFLVVGDVALSQLAPILRKAELRVGRPVNPTVYGAAEFEKRFREGNHFLKAVLQGEPLFIIGGPHELAKLTAERAR